MIEYTTEEELDKALEDLKRKKEALTEYKIKKCDKQKHKIIKESDIYKSISELQEKVEKLMEKIEEIEYPYDYGSIKEIHYLGVIENSLSLFLNNLEEGE